ncbi:hypothetical protein M422DRAFT_32048 [Sphaerobolus stellatus SS14]|uniref:ERCC1-like central domain-containing protein n=1 Tax=Sphaerobolus stellatus (strain SS14) TaxID=990650 RepID=A0A0C9UCW6_SPHS4|nr:hypothetical protein M422DRAFT_32048 [Sphaerobolus stellatus SS14]
MSTKQVPAPPVVQPSSGNAIIINSCQRLNPLLEAIRNVPKEFGDIIPDFQVGRTTGVLFLSLKYHRLHPEYIHARIEKLGRKYDLRILLLVCDVSEHQDPIRELTKTCLINEITVIVAWSNDEAAMYLTTFKKFEHKPPDMIKERVEKDYPAIFRSALTSIKSINKTDAETLRTHCGSFAGIATTAEQSLLELPGLGQLKVRRLREAFHKPFNSHAPTALDTFVKKTTKFPSTNVSGNHEDTVEDPSVTGPKPSSSSTDQPARNRPPRSPSPVWDIELDLNDSPPPEDSLYLPPKKKQKVDKPFGEGPSG